MWASLARDYLAIQASSVSSERAFSSAGITISKRRNRLKANIVEALQFLKMLMRKDLLMREPELSSLEELGLEDEEDEWKDPDGVEVVQKTVTAPWDSILVDDDSDEEDYDA